MKVLKIGALAVAAAFMMGLIGATTFASEAEKRQPSVESYFLPIKGTVEKIHPQKDNLVARIEIKDVNGNPAYFMIKEDTVFDKTSKSKLKKGDKVIGFVKAKSPMVMIYPPQYPVTVVIEEHKNLTAKADLFDAKGVSQDGTLKIRVDSKTEVVLPSGESYSGTLVNQLLLVYYDVSTRSIPAQTTPKRIVVLGEPEVVASQPNVEGYPLVVAGKRLIGASAFNRADGTIMVPARAVLEGLGHEITWDVTKSEVIVNQGVSSFRIGSTEYHLGRMTPISLEAAPELRNGKTYIPLSYFQRVLKTNNAFVFEGQIEINNDEKMN